MFNGTLIAQLLNFCIGYYLLKYILLKPALAIIQAQEAREQQLNYDIVDFKNKLATQEAANKQFWRECLQQLMQQKPSLEKDGTRAEFPMVELPQIMLSERDEHDLTALVTRRSMAYIMHEKSL